MPIDFPNSPTTGQVYTYLGRSWVWNGVAWDAPSSGSQFLNRIVQVVSSQTTNSITGTFGGSTNPTSTSGTLYHSFNFTPRFSNSKLLLQSTNLLMGEYSNVADEFCMGAFYDTTRVALVVATAPAMATSSLNFGFYSFNNLFNSWGTTEKTINIRIGGSAGGGSMYANTNYQYNVFGSDNRIVSFTLMEISE
jgi:hypothetical protein